MAESGRAEIKICAVGTDRRLRHYACKSEGEGGDGNLRDIAHCFHCAFFKLT